MIKMKGNTTGGAMVDHCVPNPGNWEVYSVPGKIYSAYLMVSDCNKNNNKYYLIQVLRNLNNGGFAAWNRWGRVGVDGMNSIRNYGNAAAAIADYDKKFHDKTVKGRYTKIEVTFEDEDEKKADKGGKGKKGKEEKKKDQPKSKLDTPLQNLIRDIYNMKMMEKSVVEVGYDAKKLPLGKLSKDTIK